MGRFVRPFFLRLGQFAVSLLTLIFLSFGLLKFFPGSPLNDEKSLDPLVTLTLQEFYGLNKNIFEQFLLYLERLIHGDLGTSMYFTGRSVGSLILECGKTSGLLGLLAFALAIGGAFIYALTTRNFPQAKGWADRVLLILMSIPTLALAPACIWFFAFYLRWLPVALLETPQSLILPVILLSLKPMISLSRVLSSSLDQVLIERYIQTARAVGISESKILRKFALKNSLTSLLSQVAAVFASLISGSFLIETLFAIPGLGQQFVESILNRDWPMILGLTLFYGILLMLTQMITDLLIAFNDPRTEAL